MLVDIPWSQIARMRDNLGTTGLADERRPSEADRSTLSERTPTVATMAIARFPVIVVDCPDPEVMAGFYGELLGWTLDPGDDDLKFIRADYGDALGFQRVADFTPPRWPGQDVPQQMHIDVTVDDLDIAESAVIALGASKPTHQPGTTFRVFLDPAGHPFCLCAP